MFRHGVSYPEAVSVNEMNTIFNLFYMKEATGEESVKIV
jgi:hypothetical protein